MKEKLQYLRAKWSLILRILLRVFLVIVLLSVALTLAINIPAVQNIIAGKIIKSIREKTGTGLRLGSVRVALPNTVHIKDIFIQDQKADTLLFLHSLDVNIDLFSLLRKQISISSIKLEDLVTHIHREKQENAFNFEFFIDAITSGEGKSDTIVKKGSPWIINLQDISLKDVHATFLDSRSGINARVDLGSFKTSVKDFNLEKKICKIENIDLDHSSLQVISDQLNDKKALAVTENESITPSDTVNYFPAWNVSIDQLDIENTNFRLDDNSFPKMTEGFDDRHIFIKDFKTGIRNISVSGDGVGAEISNLNLTEQCGLNLKKLAVQAQFTGHFAEIKNLEIETTDSRISGDARVNYSSINNLLKDPWNCELMVELRKALVNTKDVVMFVPALAGNELAGKFRNSNILITAKASGKINNLNFQIPELSLLKKTTLKSHGTIKGLPNPSKLDFNVTLDLLSSNTADIYKFIDPSVFAGLKLPESFNLTGTAVGKINDLKADVQFVSAYGNIGVKGFYRSLDSAHRDSFRVDFKAADILAGVITGDSLLGKVSVSGNASGKGIITGNLSGSAVIDIQEAQFNNYLYKDIQINGRMDNKVISATAGSGDPNLNFKLTADADLLESKQKYKASLYISRLNLHALNFAKKDIAISTNLTAELSYAGLENSEATLNLINTKLIRKESTVPIKILNVNAVSLPDSLRFNFNSDLADGTISSNIKPENLVKTLNAAFQKYFNTSDTIQVESGKQLAMLMNVHTPKDFICFFVPECKSDLSGRLEGIYSSNKNELSVKIQVPKAGFSSLSLDSLGIIINGRDEKLSMDLHLAYISYDSLFIDNIRIKEEVSKGIILSEIKILDSLEYPKYLFVNQIDLGKDFFRVRFLPKGLILDGAPWTIEESNFLEKNKNGLSAQKFVFTKDKQSIGFTAGEENRKLHFTEFALTNLINIVQFEGYDNFIEGNLNGEVVFPSSEKPQYINANLSISPLTILNKDYGNIVLKVNTTDDKMDIETKIENQQNGISLNGTIDHLSEKPVLNLNLLVGLNNLHDLEKYSTGYLSELDGRIKGEISIKGTPDKPELDGYLGFEKTAFKINSLNFLARINDDKIQFTNEGVKFNDFVIEDAQAKKLTVNGNIISKNFKDFGCDLHLVTKDFQPINSTVDDNPLFYGKLSLDTDVKIKGDLKIPKIEANVKINSATNLTYAMPGSELKLVSSEGVVQFLDSKQSPDSINIARKSESLPDSLISRFSGINYSVNLEIDPEANFKVDIDPKSGDYLTIGGGAKLNITGDGAGNQSVTGIYEVKKGIYQISFYGLVKKSFTIAPGSTVTWSGPPMDAEVKIAATYTVRTSSVALVANETTSMSDAEKNIFNQRLPYEVKLNIGGLLSKPDISFNINLPDKYLITYPLVASKLAQLNTEEMTSELNKQVFALLVTGSFLASNPLTSTGSSPTNIASTAARNSVNSILADQLNNVSNKYISGVDVNFGLTTYEDYTQSSGDTRTELAVQFSKKLFNDRLKIEAQGSYDLNSDKNKTTSTSTENMTGEFAIIYSLTETGEYKLKTYHQNVYDYFYGEVAYSGIALIFEKEFDSLKRKKVKSEK